MSLLDPSLVRRHILAQSRRAQVGHIGSALSVVELLCAVYGGALRHSPGRESQRDRFVLSKGHAALALYVVLFLQGRIAQEELESFCCDDTDLGVHPAHRLSGVDFSTGSLGMGLGFAAGAALAARIQGSDRRAFALLSDGECNEGSIWEAAMFAGHHGLSNLAALIDLNGQQALGRTADVLAADNMAERWRTFGWEVAEVDGHDLPALASALAGFDYEAGRPHLIVGRTVSGKGVAYMERQIKWHYLPMNDEEFARAIDEVESFR